jgi:hypothetical protein
MRRTTLTIALLGLSVCQHAAFAETPLVLTQAPQPGPGGSPKTALDAEYPAGTRLVVVKAPFTADRARVLSEGLAAAGSPVMSYDGEHVVFAGKGAPDSAWQVYEARVGGGGPRALTSIPGGAMHPAVLPDGSIVFASPVPAPGKNARPQLYVQRRGAQPQQLTFASLGATDPTLLADGRILYVSAQPASEPGSKPGQSLYTINNDGTEITGFACQHDKPAFLYSPWQLKDRRVVFLASEVPEDATSRTAEWVRMARPFLSRATLFSETYHARSVRPYGESNLLVCAEVSGGNPGARCSWACFSVSPGTMALGNPLCAYPGWDSVEAIEAAPSARPMGRLSNMDPAKRTGQILCLDVNDTTVRNGTQPAARATQVRVITQGTAGSVHVLGAVPVQADGSFMAEVPADVLLGFEALDEQGQVLRREAPSIWVRAGENRSCVGCHAAHGRAPHNHRPVAVRVPVPRLAEAPQQTMAKQAR